jgi:hypothetical protein
MRKVLLQLLFISAISFGFISCEKDQEPFPGNASAEKSLIKIMEASAGPLKTLALDLTPGISSIKLIEIRRDASAAAELNSIQVVKVKLQNSLISDPSSGAIYELPRNLYTNDASNPFDGQYWTVTFNPGEFVKFLKINIDPSLLISLGKRVGLGFQLAEAPGALISNDLFQVGVEISAKNAYDGVYNLTWTNYHPASNPGYTGSTTEIEMHTTAANKVKMYWPLAGAYCAPSILNNALQYFGIQEPEYTVNTSTNAITVQNVAAGAVTFYSMATGFNSRYDPATKTIYAKWGYNYGAGGAFDPANTREWTQTAVYVRPR